MKVKFCKNCLYSEHHPLGIEFNDDGLCSGCLIHKEKYTLDWNYRFDRLKKLVSRYKSKKKNYDCIVPVTGSGDSYYIVHIVKNILKMKPLLVTYNKYYNSGLGIRNLANLRIKFNLDIHFKNVNIETVKKITRSTLKTFGSIYWHCIAGQTVFPVQMARDFKIPLIFWGAHQGLEQVGMFSHKHEVEMTRRYRKEHDLMGYEAEDLLNSNNELHHDDIYNYLYPEFSDINNIGIRGLYLGNYIKWDVKKQHEKMISLYNYKTCNFSKTMDKYDHTDCAVYMFLHDKLKLYKHGFSKITDQLSREIRFKRISRNNAIRLLKKHEAKENKKIDKLFCNWLGIEEDSLDFVLKNHINQKFWKRKNLIQYTPNLLSGYLSKEINNKTKSFNKLKYINNSKLLDKNQKNFIIFGKGI